MKGRFLIDDVDISRLSHARIAEKLGLVLQDSFMFYGDISSNIRLFNGSITDEQVKQAAEFVQADRFIDKPPGTYHAKVVKVALSFPAANDADFLCPHSGD